MSLNAKVTLIMALTLVLLMAFSHSVLLAVVGRSFEELETAQAFGNFKRIEQGITRELRYILQVAEDWSSWDETYVFAEDQNDRYKQANLVFPTFTGLGINVLMIFDSAGDLLWGEVYDLGGSQELGLDVFYPEDLKSNSRLVGRQSELGVVDGILLTRRGPMLLASLPILTNEGKGPSRGTLVMGRFFDAESIEKLEQQTGVRFAVSIAKADESSIPTEIAPELDRADRGPIRHDTPYVISNYSALKDINESQLLLIKVDTPKDIGKLAEQTIWITAILIALCGSIALLSMSFFLNRYVLRPVSRLTGQVITVSRTGALTESLELSGQDEIAVLAREFKSMLDKLRSARRELLEQSYKAGMAETASGTLHNIRNGLNPVVSRVSQIKAYIDNGPVEKLVKAIAGTSDRETPPIQREKFRRYVELASESLLERDRAIRSNLEDVTWQVSEIEKILTWQNDVVRAELVIEEVDLHEAIESALSLIPKTLLANIDVHVDASIRRLGNVAAQRMTLVQIFQNILINGAEACAACKEDARIVVRTKSVTLSRQKKSVCISIVDNGIGIGRSELDNVFKRSYTTKSGARRGLGLHWCANALAVMNGEIRVESDGPNCGTSFHIVLPAV